MYAGRTRPMLKKYGARGMLIHLKEINSRQTGLRNMVEHGYAHMTFERIIIDQADKFPAKIVAQARTDLEAAIATWSPSRKRAVIKPTAAGPPRTHPGAE